MAYLETNPDEEQKQPESALDLFAAAGGSLDPATAGTGEAAPVSGARPQFAGIDTYLDANRPAAQRLGSQVAGSIRERGDTARSTIDQQLGAFNTDVGGREVQQDIGLLNQLTADPAGLAKDPERRAAFQRERDASYGGPQQLESSDFYAPISKAVGEAKRYGELASSGGGLAEILASSQPGRPQSRGALGFDAGLVQSDPTARGEIEGARSSLSDIDARLAQASAAAQTRAGQAEATTGATREAARGALTSAYGGHQSDLDARLGQAREEAVRRQQAALGALGPRYGEIPTGKRGQGATKGFQAFAAAPGAAPGEQALADLGITPEQYAQLNDIAPVVQAGRRAAQGTNNVDPYSYLAQYEQSAGDLGRYATARSPDAIGLAQVATPDDYAREAALNDLSGEQRAYLDPALADQAGTANLDTVDFDLQSAQAQREAALEEVRRRAAKQVAFNSKNGSRSSVLPKVLGGAVIG